MFSKKLGRESITMEKKISAAIFDLDGVIADTAHLHFKAWKACAKILDIEIDEAFNEQLKGIDRVTSFQRILDYGNVTVSQEIFDDMIKNKNECYVSSLQTLTSDDILPGILSFLKELIANDVKLAVASASFNAPAILEKLGIIDYFQIIVNPGTVKNGKPAPDIFIEAARLLNVPIEQCIGIEDAPAGIDAIVSANIMAIGIGKDELKEHGADIVYETTAQLNYKEIEELFTEK